MLLGVDAAYAVSWLWPSANPRIPRDTEDERLAATTSHPLTRMLPILRRRARRRDMLLVAMRSWVRILKLKVGLTIYHLMRYVEQRSPPLLNELTKYVITCSLAACFAAWKAWFLCSRSALACACADRALLRITPVHRLERV